MTIDRKRTFGTNVRSLREARGDTLRGFAAKVKMSPAYLSKVERDDFPPPGEEKVAAIARELDEDVDELLAVAGRVAHDLNAIIRANPQPLATFLRSTAGLRSEDLLKLAAAAEQRRRKGPTRKR